MSLILSLTMLASASPPPDVKPSPTSSPAGRFYTDAELQAFGEECVAQAAPEIVKAAVIEEKVKNAGLEAAQAVLERQRDDAQGRADKLSWAGTVLSWLSGLLLAASFIFGWWRFGS